MRPYGLAEGLLAKDASQDYYHNRLCTVNREVCPALVCQNVCRQYAGSRKLYSEEIKGLPWLKRNGDGVTKNGP